MGNFASVSWETFLLHQILYLPQYRIPFPSTSTYFPVGLTICYWCLSEAENSSSVNSCSNITLPYFHLPRLQIAPVYLYPKVKSAHNYLQSLFNDHVPFNLLNPKAKRKSIRSFRTLKKKATWEFTYHMQIFLKQPKIISHKILHKFVLFLCKYM